jgi:hypothetical protein
MPLCRSTGRLCAKSWYAHTPQPEDPPPGDPDEPDAPPIGDPPPDPGEVPQSVDRCPAPPAQPDWRFYVRVTKPSPFLPAISRYEP